MRGFSVFLLFSLFTLLSCNDGDILTVSLDFDKNLDLCGNTESDNYVIYDIKTDPNESLTLLFPSNSNTGRIFNPEESPYSYELSISSAVRFNYRTYDNDPAGLICQEIPSSEVSIIEDYLASGGKVVTQSTFTDDDQDGIPSENEDLNGNGNLEDDDSDGDSIPNYKDFDDDGDNVSTRLEKPDPNSDGNLDDSQDTDNDGIPDYLDTDDDNDGLITRHEDENLNGNLQDDFADGSVIARYLDNNATESFVYEVINSNVFTRTILVEFSIINTNLEIINTDFIDLGIFTSSLTIED